MKKYTETVLGSIETDKIGGTLVHEHVIASAAGIPVSYPELLGADRIERAEKALLALKERGITTVCDASPYDLGRDPKTLKLLSEKTGVNIIASTGFFMESTFGSFSEQQIADCMIKDINVGMDGTEIKAGIIKAVMDREGDTPGRKLLHHAAAMAQSETGCNIFLHSCSDIQTGKYQIPLLIEAGAKAEKIRIDHILDTADMEYISWLYDRGVWLGADRLPRIKFKHEHFVGTLSRMRTVKAMIEAGMQDRMLFSHDTGPVSTLWDTVDKKTKDYISGELCPGSWTYIMDKAVPEMVRMSIPEQALHQILFENPKRFFGSD